MTELLGIRVRITDDCRLFAGWGVHRYALRSREDAQEFIAENWAQRSPAWRARNLTVEPLPQYITVPGLYLIFGRE